MPLELNTLSRKRNDISILEPWLGFAAPWFWLLLILTKRLAICFWVTLRLLVLPQLQFPFFGFLFFHVNFGFQSSRTEALHSYRLKICLICIWNFLFFKSVKKMVNLTHVSTLPWVKIIANKKIILITCRWYNLYSLKIHLYEQKYIIKIKGSIRSLIRVSTHKSNSSYVYHLPHTPRKEDPINKLYKKKSNLWNMHKPYKKYKYVEKWTKWLKGLKRKISWLISEW